MTMRASEHNLYSNQDYDAMMRPKKRHKTSRACDECRRKKVLLFQLRHLLYRSDAMQPQKPTWNNVPPVREPASTVPLAGYR
jgi:hypothetical protein